MSALNWRRAQWREQMRFQGTEDRKDDRPLFPAKRFRRRPSSKEELRRQAEAALQTWRTQ